MALRTARRTIACPWREKVSLNGAARTDRALLVFSLLASAYFAFIALDNLFFRLEWVGVGVLRELLTIPMILAVGATCVVALARLLLNRSTFNACNAGAALILLVLNGLIWGL